MLNVKDMINNEVIKCYSRLTVSKGTILINKNGSSKTSKTCPNCGTWIKHWERLSGQKAPNDGDCAVEKCDGKIEKGHLARIEGCHVIVKDGTDKSVYIAPLCESCNHRTEGAELKLKRDLLLVKANVSETCLKLKGE